MIWISSIFGFVAIIFWLFSIQRKKKKDILFFQLIANMLYAVQYFIIGTFSAASMNTISSFKSFMFYKYECKGKEIPKLLLCVFLILVIVFGVITWNGTISLIPILITCFYTISSWCKDSKYIRIVFLIAAFFWIYFNVTVGAYIAVIGNTLEVLSGIISLIRFKKNKSN